MEIDEMNLLHKEDLIIESHFCIILVFNHFREGCFLSFIQSIIDCKPLIAELCTGDYEEINGNIQYVFDSDEGETIIVAYKEILLYAKITLQRYVDNYVNNNEKDAAEELLASVCIQIRVFS